MMTDFIYWVLMVWLIAMYGFSAWHIWKLYGYLQKMHKLVGDRFDNHANWLKSHGEWLRTHGELLSGKEKSDNE